VTPTPGATRVDGNTNAIDKRGKYGQRFTYECPPGFQLRAVWGTDMYAEESSICTAAVHMGIIRREAGGTVTIEIRPMR
jgi:hypothetical protein